MIVYILVIITTWSFSYNPYTPNGEKYQVVSSPLDAALAVYYDQKATNIGPEPDQKKYRLYLVDFEKKSIEQQEMPKIKFETSPVSADTIKINQH